MLSRWLLFAVVAALAMLGGYIYSQVEEPINDQYQFIKISEAFERPVYLTHADDDRLFVVEKQGIVLIVQDETVLATPFLDIEAKVGSGGSEQGLLSLAFAPDYAETGAFYVYYNDRRGDSIIARYQVSDDPNIADPNSETIILTQDQPYGNHNGGLVKFGNDGYLYIGLGDGGSGGDPQGHGQNLNTLLGAILRLDVSNLSTTYTIPSGNPFGTAIWAYGLRNPWRFSFDQATGDLYIADVGQNQYEEINVQAAGSFGGENYGWNVFEGNHDFRNANATNRDAFVFPIHEYSHSGGACSVTGGYVYRGEALPALQGKYFYGDWCSGTIWTLAREGDGWVNVQFMDTDFNISSFGEGADGELYLLSFDSELWKLVAR